MQVPVSFTTQVCAQVVGGEEILTLPAKSEELLPGQTHAMPCHAVMHSHFLCHSFLRGVISETAFCCHLLSQFLCCLPTQAALHPALNHMQLSPSWFITATCARFQSLPLHGAAITCAPVTVSFSQAERELYLHVYGLAREGYLALRAGGPKEVSKNLLKIMSTLLPLRRICSGGSLSCADLRVVR